MDEKARRLRNWFSRHVSTTKIAIGVGVGLVLAALVVFGPPASDFTADYFPNLFASVLDVTLLGWIVAWVSGRNTRRIEQRRQEQLAALRDAAPRSSKHR